MNPEVPWCTGETLGIYLCCPSCNFSHSSGFPPLTEGFGNCSPVWDIPEQVWGYHRKEPPLSLNKQQPRQHWSTRALLSPLLSQSLLTLFSSNPKSQLGSPLSCLLCPAWPRMTDVQSLSCAVWGRHGALRSAGGCAHPAQGSSAARLGVQGVPQPQGAPSPGNCTRQCPTHGRKSCAQGFHCRQEALNLILIS